MNQALRPLPLDEIRKVLAAPRLDGWLFYDFRGLDPIARNVLGLNPDKVGSRRWFYFVPASGEPAKLVHAIEPGMLDALPGKKTIYLSWQSLQDGLAAVLRGYLSGLPNSPGVSKASGGSISSMPYRPNSKCCMVFL